MHMKTKYTLFRRNGIYYSQDSATGQQKSLRTRDEAEALKLISARNEAHRQPVLTRLGGFDLLQKYFLSQVVDLQAGVFQKGAKQAVVKTHPIPKRKNLCIIGCGYVFALHHAEEKRQGTPLL